MGKFAEADHGTLFLDEVGELPLDMQVKLLRVLQEGEVDAVGSRKPTKVDVRIISATNRDLAQAVAEGRFREDLYYRLNVFPIEMPSLRERKEDLPALVDHFIRRFNAQEGKTITGASKDTMGLILAHDWPGNVRQLENSIFRAMILCEGDELQPIDFPQISGLTPNYDILDSATADVAPINAADTAAQLNSPIGGPVSITDDSGELRPLEEVERDLIQYAIDLYSGHMSQVARRLGIGRSTLYRKVREYDLRVREEDDDLNVG